MDTFGSGSVTGGRRNAFIGVASRRAKHDAYYAAEHDEERNTEHAGNDRPDSTAGGLFPAGSPPLGVGGYLQYRPNVVSTGDAWNRVRMPFFAGVVVILLFFFGTQRELFDSTFAVVGGLAATIPALLKMLSSFGERGAVKAA